MKRSTKILGTITVIGLVSLPVSAANDWMLPALWDWVVGVAYPMLNDHEARLTEIETSGRLVVVDANGDVLPATIIGTTINLINFYLNYEGTPVELDYLFVQNSFQDGRNRLDFVLPDCEGTAYNDPADVAGISPREIFMNSYTGRFHEANTNVIENIAVWSRAQDGNCLNFGPITPVNMHPVTQLQPFPYVLPLHVEYR